MKLEDLKYPFSQTELARMCTINAVYEGLISSAEAGLVVGKVKQLYPTISVHREQDSVNKTYKVVIAIPNSAAFTVTQFNQLSTLINNLGWFFAWQRIITDEVDQGSKINMQQIFDQLHNDYITIELSLESKYDTKLTKIPDTLYHATPTKNANKVMRIGLVPSSKNNQLAFPDRIYLAERESNLVQILIPALAAASNISNWTVFKVNYLDKIVPPLRLFKDPNYNLGYYTLTNISPHNLERIKDIVVPTTKRNY